jgi:hypothetical protein
MGLEEGFKYIKKALTASRTVQTSKEEIESGGKKTLLAEGFVVALGYLREKYNQIVAGGGGAASKEKSRL